MTERRQLPTRRPNQTFELIHDNTKFAVTGIDNVPSSIVRRLVNLLAAQEKP